MMDPDFDRSILAVEAQIVDLTSNGSLFGSEEFRALHAEPRPHLDAALSFIGDDERTEQQKMIAARIMRRLNLPDLLRFDLGLLALREREAVSATFFRRAVFPSYDWSGTLPENYQDPAAARALATMVASPAVDVDTKRYIEGEVMSGRARAVILDMRGPGDSR